MWREDWIVYVEYALLWFVAVAFVMVISGCENRPTRYKKYRLLGGKVVECASVSWDFDKRGNGMDLYNCVGGSRYHYQHNVEEMGE